MCGFACLADLRPGAAPPDPGLVERMLSAIAHRGPDDAGVVTPGTCVLGARRLSVIDLSGGHQPMSNEDGTVWVAYNGEIYNHVRLREELQAKGHVFRNHCDTEVIVHAWEEWGERFVEHLEGMFGFALWDARTSTLCVVRDRLGIKPVYYAQVGGRFAAASEIKALLATGLISPEIDLQSLYLYVGYEFVPSPATMLAGVRKLPAGHLLIAQGDRIDVKPYWDVTFEPLEMSEGEAIAEIRRLLSAAVAKRLMADVPLGVFLSGGLDSTAVLAFARQATTQPLPTFTIGYRDPSFSEWEYARRAARYYGAEHHELVIDPVTPELIEQTVWHLDEPMTDLSSLAFYLLCQKARRYVTVCLSGEGGDEVFVGYDRFIASKLNAQVYGRLPGPIRTRVIEPLIRRLPDQEQKKGPVNLLRRFVEGASLPAEAGHMRWQYFSSPALEERLFQPSFLARVQRDPFEPIRRARGGAGAVDRLSQELYVDLRMTMAESVLMKVDKMSMAHALEVRVPFLDHALVEFAARIPSGVKFPGLKTKAIYRKAMEGVLPPFVLERGKQGYSLPIKTWLRNELRDYMTGLLNESALVREHFNLAYVNTLIGEHLRRTHNHNHVLWALMNAALWHQRFVEQRPARAA
ncbi:MAG TPA: asparagine synthase (glutamine-hydrolyzing) [Vicinamibacterales bacterium]